MNFRQHKLPLILVSLLLLTFPKATVAQRKNDALPVSAPAQETVGHTTLAVTDKYGRYVSGLRKDQITILDEKTPQEILQFDAQDEAFSLVLLFDVSWSMPAEGLTKARDEFLRFVDTSNKASNYAIIGFGKQTSLLTEFTQDRDSLVAGLNQLATLKRGGGTAFYDAFNLAFEKVQSERRKKRIVLIVSDGVDNESNSRMKDLREKLKKTDVLVYGIGIKEPDLSSDLNALCSLTGGTAFYPNSLGDINVLFDAFALELKYQYSVTFRPSSSVKEGEWRRLKYKVSPLEFKKSPTSQGVEKTPLFIRGREGYFPMSSP
jgi:VWFA-related protein